MRKAFHTRRSVMVALVIMACFILVINHSSLRARSAGTFFFPQDSVTSKDSSIVLSDTSRVVQDSTNILNERKGKTIEDQNQNLNAPDTLNNTANDSTSLKNEASVDSLMLQITKMDSLFGSVSGFLLDISDSLRGGAVDSIFSFAGMGETISTADSNVVVMTERERRRHYRDSVKAVKDSIRWAKPRILETSFIPDSLYFKRILMWNTGPEINEYRKAKLDTAYNDWYSEYPFYYEDVDVNYLGPSGSATQNINFMKRREFDKFKAFAPYLVYSHTPEEMPFYNTKSPYTEMGYWGTLFAFKNKEEINVRFLHTQNITPAFNMALLVQRWSAKGMMTNEATKNNSFHFNLNYLGKKYVLHAGYIHQSIDRHENGGLQDSKMIRDTTVDAKTIPVTLNKANNALARNTFFVNHSINIPINLKKIGKIETDTSMTFLADSTLSISDSASYASSASPMSGQNDNISGDEAVGNVEDSTSTETGLGEGPMITFGHIGEASWFYRLYTDEIPNNDKIGRDFYNNMFYIDPVKSADSTHLFTIENKLFFKIQPWARDAVVNQITGGVGHQWNSYYEFKPEMFLTGNRNRMQNNLYIYAGAGGEFRKYLHWNARGKYNFIGYYQNDFDMDGNIDVSFYPFKDKTQPITLSGTFSTSLKEPDWYSQHYYSNHYVWENKFGKTSLTKVEAKLSIPKWRFELGFGYDLINNYLYNDTLGIVRQDNHILNVMNGYLKENFKLWIFRFDHRILFQYSSDKEVLPLPMLTFHLRYYLEFVAVKNALTVQLGADATFNTLFYAPAYNPALGAFQLQHDELIGNNPYIDVFLNLQWKNVSLFLKVINVAQGSFHSDMFSAYHYIKSCRAFKFGIYWPFYFD